MSDTLIDKLKACGMKPHILEQFNALDWKDLEELECDGSLLFPAKLQRLKKSGEFESIDVKVRVPSD